MDSSSSNVQLADDYRDCIASLNAHRVRYVLVGGYAVGWHGVVRATGDIDFLYDRASRNVARLCAAMGEFGAPPQLIDAEFMMSDDAVTQIGQEPFRIDLLASISGVSFKEVFAGAVKIELEGQRLLVIGLAELLRNKAATGRVKDVTDLRRLAAAGRQDERARPVKREPPTPAKSKARKRPKS
ncbi:MAG: nucleotidyltransferase family protein [Gemmatimonadetes bacterium]|jgi:hypothetical protein|nr:nucleotidyltransferase family protein [Gemmatimonadota bacterium]